jgi:hypothetical protein
MMIPTSHPAETICCTTIPAGVGVVPSRFPVLAPRHARARKPVPRHTFHLRMRHSPFRISAPRNKCPSPYHNQGTGA